MPFLSPTAVEPRIISCWRRMHRFIKPFHTSSHALLLIFFLTSGAQSARKLFLSSSDLNARQMTSCQACKQNVHGWHGEAFDRVSEHCNLSCWSLQELPKSSDRDFTCYVGRANEMQRAGRGKSVTEGHASFASTGLDLVCPARYPTRAAPTTARTHTLALTAGGIVVFRRQLLQLMTWSYRLFQKSRRMSRRATKCHKLNEQVTRSQNLKNIKVRSTRVPLSTSLGLQLNLNVRILVLTPDQGWTGTTSAWSFESTME